MKKLLLSALLASLALGSSAFAGNVKIPKDEPLVVINFPKDWNVEVEDDTINANSADDEIYVNVEIDDSDSIEGAVLESIGYLQKNKVKIDKSTEKQTEAKVNGLDATDIEWTGTDEDGPCKCGLTFYAISKDKAVVILYWASVDGEKKHAEDIQKIFNSVKKAN